MSSFGIFFYVCSIGLIKCVAAELEYFSTAHNQFKNHKLHQKESSALTFVTLAHDPKSQFTDSFTICSSIQIKFIYGATHFVQMYKDDGSHWFSLHILTNLRDTVKMSEVLRIMFEHPKTGKIGDEFLLGPVIPVVPHSWYRSVNEILRYLKTIS